MPSRCVFSLPPFRAVLFDLDGTLVRTFIDFAEMRRGVEAIAQRRNVPSAFHGETDVMEMVGKITGALGGEAGNEARGEAYALFARLEANGCAHPEAIEPASDLLIRLRGRNTRIGIITRNCRPVADGLTRRMNLPYDVLVAREDTEQWKPHPAPVFFACEKLRVLPGECVMVGDLWADIAAGKAAGVGATIGIAWPRDGVERFAKCSPDVEVASLHEAAQIINGAAASAENSR